MYVFNLFNGVMPGYSPPQLVTTCLEGYTVFNPIPSAMINLEAKGKLAVIAVRRSLAAQMLPATSAAHASRAPYFMLKMYL